MFPRNFNQPLGQAPAEFRHRRKGGRLSRFHPRHGRHETLDTHDTIAAVGKEFWTMENLDETYETVSACSSKLQGLFRLLPHVGLAVASPKQTHKKNINPDRVNQTKGLWDRGSRSCASSSLRIPHSRWCQSRHRPHPGYHVPCPDGNQCL